MSDNFDTIYEFGKTVAVNAREHAIQNIFDLLTQKRNDLRGKLLAEKMAESNFSQRQIDSIKMLAIDCIDMALYGIFVNFEESMGQYKIMAKDKQGRLFDMVTESDGLPYGYLEFVDRFSKYSTADEFLETGKLEKDTVDKADE